MGKGERRLPSRLSPGTFELNFREAKRKRGREGIFSPPCGGRKRLLSPLRQVVGRRRRKRGSSSRFLPSHTRTPLLVARLKRKGRNRRGGSQAPLFFLLSSYPFLPVNLRNSLKEDKSTHTISNKSFVLNLEGG